MTLHWFVHPLWFQEMGAFTREENIPVFVEWAQLAFELFGESRPVCVGPRAEPRSPRPQNTRSGTVECGAVFAAALPCLLNLTG